MALPKISIIIPVYNVEPYIAECLRSVMRQRYQGPMECIVVDDCGTDKSIEVAEKLIAEYVGPIVFQVLHHEKNLGLSCARNTGIKSAIGDYIYFLDSDDWVTDDCLEVLAAQAKNGDYDVIVGNSDQFGMEEKDGYPIPKEGLKLSGEDYVIKYLKGFQVPATAWNKLFKRVYVKSNNMFFVPGLLYEDQVFNFMLTSHPTAAFVSPVITYHYRNRKDSICNQCSNNMLLMRDSLYKVWMNICQRCDRENYIEAQELYLTTYGNRICRISRENDFPLWSMYYQMHKFYPYRPLCLWISGKQRFRWLKARMVWWLPSMIGYLWMQLKWMNNKDYVYAR